MPATLACEKVEPWNETPPERPPWNPQKCGQSAVLWGLVAFVLSQVVLRVLIDSRRPEMRDPTFENKYRLLTSRLAACPGPRTSVIFFGSSMTVYGINAGMLEEPLSKRLNKPALAFNLGTYSAGPLMHLVYLRRLLARGIRPDLAVVELAPIVYDSGHPPDTLRLPASMLVRGDVEVVERYANDPDFRSEWWQSYFVPVYGHRLTMLHDLAYCLVPFKDRMAMHHDVDAWGWRKQEVAPPECRARLLARVGKHLERRLPNFAPVKPPFQALTELLEVLKTEQIPALLVVMPEGPLSRSLYADGPLTQLLNDFDALCHSYHFPCINARAWFEEDRFSDSHHLTPEGACLFTERLGRDVVRILANRRKGIENAGNAGL